MVEQKTIKVLHITPMYPSKARPSYGTFIKSQIDSLTKYVDNELLIIEGEKGLVPYILAIPRILKKIYISKFDIIHIHYGNLSSLVKLLYWGKVPIVTSYCGSDLLGAVIHSGKYSIKSLFFKRLNSFLSRKDACSIVKSKELADEITKAKRIEIVPNGVNVNQFRAIDKDSARKKLGLFGSQKKIILFPADTEIPLKNYKFLVKVMTNFDQKEFEVLTFEGNNVRHEDVPYYFNAADIVVFTSLSEGSPNVIKEAMACNCKIYSTSCGDVTWLLKDVKGSNVLSYDVLEWEKMIAYFFKNKDLIDSDSRIRLLDKKLDTKSIAKKVVDIYYSLIVPKN